MNIKMLLKEYDCTLSEFANALFLSRPTLNSYIHLYENNHKISDKKYQILFDRMFSKKIEKEEFYRMLEKCNTLVAKDQILETTDLSPRKTDIIIRIVEDIKRDFNSDGADENIYIFIRMIINYYKKLPLLKKISNYFLSLNNKINYDDLSKKEKEDVLLLYQCFDSLKNDEVSINFKKWEIKFKERIKSIESQNKKIEEEINNRIKLLIEKEIKNQIQTGKDVNSITVEDVLNNISKE